MASREWHGRIPKHNASSQGILFFSTHIYSLFCEELAGSPLSSVYNKNETRISGQLAQLSTKTGNRWKQLAWHCSHLWSLPIDMIIQVYYEVDVLDSLLAMCSDLLKSCCHTEATNRDIVKSPNAEMWATEALSAMLAVSPVSSIRIKLS